MTHDADMHAPATDAPDGIAPRVERSAADTHRDNTAELETLLEVSDTLVPDSHVEPNLPPAMPIFDAPPGLHPGAARAPEAGATARPIRVNGSARLASDWAVTRGLPLTGIGLMLSSRPVGQLDRYVTSGADALY